MIKVMFDIYQFCDHIHGGVYTYFYNLLEELMLTGEVKTFFSARDQYSYKVHKEVERYIKHFNTLRYTQMEDFDLFPYREFYDRSIVERVANRLWRTAMKKVEPRLKGKRQQSFFGNEADVYHYTDHFYPHVAMPTVATIHDLIWKNKPQYFTKEHVKAAGRNFYFMASTANHLSTVSEKTRQDVLKHGKVDPERVSVVYPGIDSHFFVDDNDAAKQAVLKRLGLRQEPYFVCLATLEPRKNHLGILHAFIELKRSGGFENHQLLIIGPSGWKFEKIRAEIDNSEAAEAIHIAGMLDRAEIRQILNGATALLFPSFDEGFGSPPVEAMACGCPVVASRLGSLPEVLGDHAEYVDAYKSEDIARGMASLAKDKQHRQKLVLSGLEWAKRYDYSKTARQSLEIYERLVQEDRKRFGAGGRKARELGIFRKKSKERLPEKAPEKTQCPQCGSLEFNLEYSLRRDPRPDAAICRCNNCGLIFHHFHLDSEQRQPEDKHGKAMCRAINQPYHDFSFELQLLESHAKEGEVLDIGWSWPHTLKPAREMGFEISAQENRPVFSNIGQTHLGLDVRSGSLEESAWENERFEAVTLLDSINSLEKPWEELPEISRILKPQGVLIIRTHNFDSYRRTLQGRNWPFLDPDCFNYHFNREALSKMLSPFFDVVEFICREDEISRRISGKVLTEKQIEELEKGFKASQLLVVARKK